MTELITKDARLWVRETTPWAQNLHRPASPSEVLEAARQLEGAEVVEAIQTNMGINPVNRPWVRKPGTYLIIPLGIPRIEVLEGIEHDGEEAVWIVKVKT